MIHRFCIGLLATIALPALAQQKFPPISRDDRIVVVAPHPDDDVLGAGGLIQQALAVGADVRVIYLTSGDHNQVPFKLYKLDLHLTASEYLVFGEKRRKEAIAATGKLGLPADHLTFLGYPDWGTLRMWREYWDAPQPFRSDATRVSAVPYEKALCPGKPYRPQSVVEDFCALFRQFRPTRIVVTHPADTNPDHRAAANFVRLAALDVEGEGLRPALYYYVVHFRWWPRPYHYHPAIELEPPRALLDNGDWMTLPLTPEQTHRKYEAILENKTQITTRHYYLVSFACANELFATIPLAVVPCLPAHAPLDWRRALRHKTLACPPSEPGDPINPRVTGEEWLSIDHTDFLRQGDDLIALVELRSRLGKRTGVHLYLYGYRPGTAFAELPKVHVNINPLGRLAVAVDGARVAPHGVRVQSVSNRFIIRIPLTQLGGPDITRVFTSTRAHLGSIAADDTAWQLFALQSTPET